MSIPSTKAHGLGIRKVEKLANITSVIARAGFASDSGSQTVSSYLKLVRRDWLSLHESRQSLRRTCELIVHLAKLLDSACPARWTARVTGWCAAAIIDFIVADDLAFTNVRVDNPKSIFRYVVHLPICDAASFAPSSGLCRRSPKQPDCAFGRSSDLRLVRSASYCRIEELGFRATPTHDCPMHCVIIVATTPAGWPM